MKTRITTAVAAVTMLGATFAAVSGAATEQTINGKMTSISYNVSAKTGKMHVLSSSGKKTTIALNAKTDCGVARGQSGNQVPCKSLVASKYKDKPVRVIAKRYSDGHRVASIVGVNLSK